jgi:hypothetical protein
MPLLTPCDSTKGHTNAHKIFKDCKQGLERVAALFSIHVPFPGPSDAFRKTRQGKQEQKASAGIGTPRRLTFLKIFGA